MIYKTLKKVSDYCQLLDKSKFPATRTINGVTFTNNGDGSFTIDGTASERTIFNVQNIGANRAPYVHVDLSNSSRLMIIKDSVLCEYSSYTPGNGWCYFFIPKGGVIKNLVAKPQLFDLTEMYGAGNEPTTVEEFKADFPNDLYDYKPYCFVPSYKNCLIHPIPITSGNLIDFPYASSYDTRQGMTFSQVDTYKVHASGINNNYNGGVAFDFVKGKTLPAGTYTVKYYTEGTVTTDLYFRGRKNSYYGPTLFPDNTRQKTFTLTEDTTVYISFGFVGGVDNRFTGETIDLTVWCRLERGTDVTDYISSYKKSLICTTKNLFDKSLVTENARDFANCTLIETTKNGWIIQGNPGKNPGQTYHSSGWFSPGDTAAKNNNQGVMLKGGDVVTVSAYYTVLEDNFTVNIIGIFLHGTHNTTFYHNVGVKTRVSSTFTIPDGKDITAYYPTFTLNSSKILIEDIQIEYGTTLTEYHPYGYL